MKILEPHLQQPQVNHQPHISSPLATASSIVPISDSPTNQNNNNTLNPPTTLSSFQQQINEAIQYITTSNQTDPQKLKTGINMLFMYTNLLQSNPTSAKYRKIYTKNSNFQNNIASLEGALAFLELIGFKSTGNHLEYNNNHHHHPQTNRLSTTTTEVVDSDTHKEGEEERNTIISQHDKIMLKEACQALKLLKEELHSNSNQKNNAHG
mmetsp:Transcript_26222/g.38858  ORF Transcript_26222/g.38858 Transcript_26222/m.38858 type:complete len:209 (-) Transcript_26222:149-775(-)